MTTGKERADLAEALHTFGSKDLHEAALQFWSKLGYSSPRTLTIASKEEFRQRFDPNQQMREDRASWDDWHEVAFLFQLTDQEIASALTGQLDFAGKGKFEGASYESFIFLAIRLGDHRYTRTQLASIVREVNTSFLAPVIILFRHGETITVAAIQRRLHKRDESRDVLGKVTLIKDIRFEAPHRAHVDILSELALLTLRQHFHFHNFVGLHRAWQETLDIQTLNRKFFVEVRNWFYWARVHTEFPAGATKDAEKRDSEALIRLLTRLIFCWFLREKAMLPRELFEAKNIESLLRNWDGSDTDQDTEGRYYKAILQNLFFATLATPVHERQFRSNRTYKGHLNKHYGDQRYFRHVNLFAEKAPVEELYKSIPFLNGGLFENLDEFPGEDNDLKGELRVDGFSDVASKQPLVPDFLFFGEERRVPEIATLLGESSTPKARGLLKIFSDYKFTIEENTPLEQDIALDPELLGRTFENLLAAVNPETGTVARKSTGSYYTPREIVHYMAEEALVRFLLGVLAKGEPNSSLEEKLRELVSEAEPSHRLNREAQRIVALIGQLRILDPACGSGAFPMGLLQLLVHVLRKLDPHNEHWKAVKLEALPPEMREKAVEVFQGQSFDYSRKLELIKDCIHGVDIQPTAIQICKLRFFLSLVIEQGDSQIRPLPNLEVKFVCANSLIGLPRPKDWELFQHQIEPKERALLEVRSRFFFAETKKEKDACKTADRELRRELSEFIEGIGGSAAKHLASAVSAWDPYHSDHRANYFDPESMFGVPGGKLLRPAATTLGTNFSAIATDELTPYTPLEAGFDITIGNPPYVRADEQSEWNRYQRGQILASAQYETLWEKWDLFVPFIERSYKLLRPGGVSTLIVSDAFCHSKYAQKPQNWFLKHARILRLDYCGEIKIFDAAVHNVIYFFQRAGGAKWKPERRLHRQVFGEVTLLPTDEQAKLTYRVFLPRADEHDGFSGPTIPIENICYLSYGLAASSDEKLHKGEFVTEDVTQDVEDEQHPKPWVEGKLLAKWMPLGNRWLEWGTKRAPSHFRRITFEEMYEVPEKILIMRVAGSDLRSCYDTRQLYTNHTSIIAVPWRLLHGVRNNSLKKTARYRGEKPPRPDLPKREELEAISRRFTVKFLLGVMNSGTARDFLRGNRRSNTDLYPEDWKKLPIPDVPIEQQQPVVQVVDLILALHRYFHARPVQRTARDTVLLEFLENLNDALVRELYTPDELHARSLHFSRLVAEAHLPKVETVKDAAHLEKIRKALEEASEIDRPLRAALFDLGSLKITEDSAAAV